MWYQVEYDVNDLFGFNAVLIVHYTFLIISCPIFVDFESLCQQDGAGCNPEILLDSTKRVMTEAPGSQQILELVPGNVYRFYGNRPIVFW